MRISDWSSDVCSSDLVLVFGLGSPGILDAECGKHCFEVILERLNSASLSPVLNTKRETQKPIDVRATSGEKAARHPHRNAMPLKPADEKFLALPPSQPGDVRTSAGLDCRQPLPAHPR